MKTLFLAGLITLVGVQAAMAEERPREYWVVTEGGKVIFHLQADMPADSPGWGNWVKSVIQVAQDISAKQSMAIFPKVTPDPDKGEMLLQFTMGNPKAGPAELIKAVSERLGRTYKQVKAPKK